MYGIVPGHLRPLRTLPQEHRIVCRRPSNWQRLRLGYQVSDTTDLREVTILPSILINHYWTRDLSLELEIGAKWTERQQAGATQTESDLFFTAGFRYDFYPDRQKPCGLVTTCR